MQLVKTEKWMVASAADWLAVSQIITSAKEVMFLPAFVYLFVCRIMQKLVDRFSLNSVERWHMRKKTDILVVIRITYCWD